MSMLLLAGCDGYQRCGPGERLRRIREGQEVVWNWPWVKEGEEPGEDTVLPHPSWTVIKVLGDVETAERMSQRPKQNTDFARNNATNDHFAPEVVRGHSDEDKELIRAAVAMLEPSDGNQWTAAGKPSVEAVATEIQKIHEAETGKGAFPRWVRRDVIDAASDVTQKSA